MGNTIERFQFIFLVAGIGFFALAFVVSGLVTVNAVSDLPYTSLDEISQEVSPYFVALSRQYPQQFETYYPGGPTSANYREALNLGRNVYISEACWHCHSQQVRPVANEDVRFGPVSTAAEQPASIPPPEYPKEICWGSAPDPARGFSHIGAKSIKPQMNTDEHR